MLVHCVDAMQDEGYTKIACFIMSIWMIDHSEGKKIGEMKTCVACTACWNRNWCTPNLVMYHWVGNDCESSCGPLATLSLDGWVLLSRIYLLGPGMRVVIFWGVRVSQELHNFTNFDGLYKLWKSHGYIFQSHINQCKEALHDGWYTVRSRGNVWVWMI